MKSKIVLLVIIFNSILIADTINPSLKIGVDVSSLQGLLGLSIRAKSKSNVYGIVRCGYSPSFYMNLILDDNALFADAIQWLHDNLEEKPSGQFSVDIAIGYQLKGDKLNQIPLFGFGWYETYQPLTYNKDHTIYIQSTNNYFYIGYEIEYIISKYLSLFSGVKINYSKTNMKYYFLNQRTSASPILPSIYLGITFI